MIFQSPGTAGSTTMHYPSTSSRITISGLRCSSTLSVGIMKFHRILQLSFSCTDSVSCRNHFSLQTVNNFLHSNQRISWPKFVVSSSKPILCKERTHNMCNNFLLSLCYEVNPQGLLFCSTSQTLCFSYELSSF